MKNDISDFEILEYGDQALLVMFRSEISITINKRVNYLFRELDKVKGVTYMIPAYSSLTVGYNSHITFHQLSDHITALLQRTGHENKGAQRHITIPVCYANEFALDKSPIMENTRLSWAEVIHTHSEAKYHVYMLGFLPGFAYMGGLPARLHSPRKSTPRARVPGQSVGIAGSQTGIYPFEAPGGWQIIGRTPIPVFTSHLSNPFLFAPGDKVIFDPISLKTFLKLANKVKQGTFNQEVLYG